MKVRRSNYANYQMFLSNLAPICNNNNWRWSRARFATSTLWSILIEIWEKNQTIWSTQITYALIQVNQMVGSRSQFKNRCNTSNNHSESPKTSQLMVVWTVQHQMELLTDLFTVCGQQYNMFLYLFEIKKKKKEKTNATNPLRVVPVSCFAPVVFACILAYILWYGRKTNYNE